MEKKRVRHSKNDSDMYYYTLKNGKTLNYNVNGIWEHPENECTFKTTQPPLQGKMWKEGISNESVIGAPDKNGDQTRTDTDVLKLKKCSQGRKDLLCNYCKEPFIWKGYKVWVEKVVKPGKIVGGMFRMGRETKTYMTRWFNKKGQQMKFIEKFLEKERGEKNG